MDRRTFLTRSAGATAGVTAGMWAAPVIHTVGVSAAAGTPFSGRCTGYAADVIIVYTGTVEGEQGPAQDTTRNQDTPDSACDPGAPFPCDCIGFATASVLPAPAPNPLLNVSTIRAQDDCVENDFSRSCSTAVQLLGASEQSVQIAIGGPLTIPPTELTATLIRSDATASCGDEGPVVGGNSTIVDGTLKIGGSSHSIPDGPPPNTDLPIPPIGPVTVTVVLNQQIDTGNQIEVNAIRITIEVLDPDGSGVLQTADIKIGHAVADVHDCETTAA